MHYKRSYTKPGLLLAGLILVFVVTGVTAYARPATTFPLIVAMVDTVGPALAKPMQSAAADSAIERIYENSRLPPVVRQIYTAILKLHNAIGAQHGNFNAAHDELIRGYAGGNAMSALELGVLYGDPDFKRHDQKTSFIWLRRAAEAGLVGAIPLMIDMLRARARKGDKRALKQWLHWLEVGAEQGVQQAELRVARAYARGYLVDMGSNSVFHVPGLAPDPEQAAYWFERAVPEAGSWEIDKIADRFQNGYGVPQRLDEAVRLYKLESATGGDRGEGYNDAAWLLAACPLVTQAHKGEAVDLAQRALAISRQNKNGGTLWNATIEDTLAGAYARDGNYTQAVNTERKAIKWLKNAEGREGIATALSRFRKHLIRYRQSRPWMLPNKCREPWSQSAFPDAENFRQ